jgi:hypothetical protein
MRLLEAKDAERRDVRLIVREAYQSGGSYEGLIEHIRVVYGETIQLGTLHNWFSDWGWSVQRVLVTPGIPENSSALADSGSVATAA